MRELREAETDLHMAFLAGGSNRKPWPDTEMTRGASRSNFMSDYGLAGLAGLGPRKLEREVKVRV